jgi:hypothetical protein
MERSAEQLRLELSRLFYEQADSAEKKTHTVAERCKSEERQERINELCADLRRMALKRTLAEKKRSRTELVTVAKRP